MKLSGVANQLRTVRRRGGPVARILIALMLLPPCAGCWWQRHTRREAVVEPSSAAEQYYKEGIANAAAYDTRVDMEIPMVPPPRTSRNPEAQEKWEMTLREAIEIALKNSKIVRQIQGRNGVAAARQDIANGYDPAIAEARIQQELARFDTSLIFNLFWSKSEEQINNNVAGGSTVGISPGVPFLFEQDSFGGAAARQTGLPGAGDVLTLRKLLVTGGEVTGGFNTDYDFTNVTGSRAFQAAYNTRFFTTFRQPLMQGRGVELNRAPIIIARLEADRTVWEFKRAIAELVRDVEQKYWELVIAETQLQGIKKAVELNAEIVWRLERELEEGKGDAAALTAAKEQLTTLRREALNALSGGGVFSPSRQRLVGEPVMIVERQLRGLLGLPPTDDRRIVPLDEPMVVPVEPNWESSILDAFTYNPELQALRLRIAARREALRIAADGLKPRLDFFIKQEWQGLEGEFDESIGEVNDKGLGSTTGGVQYQYTFGYRQAAGLVQQRRSELDQEREFLRDKGREVVHALSQQYGQVLDRFDIYALTKQALEHGSKNLELTYALFREGRGEGGGGLAQLLRAVDEYSNLVTEEISDRAAYQIALANLEVTKGTIFRYDSIHVHEDPWPAAAYPQAVRQAEDRARAIEVHHGEPRATEPPERIRVYAEPDGDSPEHGHLPAPTETPIPYGRDPGPDEIPVNLSARKPPKRASPASEFILPASLELEVPVSESTLESSVGSSDP
jgi:outer membrane protein TolC